MNPKSKKPIKIIYIWIIFILLFLIFPESQIPAYSFFGCLIGSFLIYSKNKKEFGSEYWKKQK